MHLLSLFELDREAILSLFAAASEMKATGERSSVCVGRMLGLLFEKPSLRTRVSFEAGMAQLGGSAVYLSSDAGWGKRESVEDFARVFSSYVDVIAFRGFEQAMLEQFAAHCSCPVINALTNEAHPCQALGDLFTLYEDGQCLDGRKVVFIGDPNNVARSLAVACATLNMPFVLASPEQYRFPADFVQRLKSVHTEFQTEQTEDACRAVEGAAAVYTDVWTSMGFEAEKSARTEAFSGYQVNQALMDVAGSQATFMHCLPAHRGEEVTDEVMDGPQSVVIRQAENRMHIQKAIIRRCLGLN